MNFRPAVKQDREFSVGLILSTIGAADTAILGLGSRQRAFGAIAFFHEGDNRFGRKYTLIAESDGTAAGLLLSFPGGRLAGLSRALLPAMLRYYGWLDALRVLKKAYPSFNHPEARVDEYHIAHLAVAQFQQRQGVASALLGEAENLAQRSGYRKCSLCVDLDNDPARALYDRHGYTVADTFDTPELMERYGNPGYERRVKHL